MVAAEPSRTARPVAREASSAITNGAGRTGRRTRVRAHVSPDVARPAFPAPGGKRAPGRAQPRMRGRGLNLGSAEAAALETRRRPDVRDERLPAAPAVRSLAFQKLHVILQGVATKARFILNTITLHGRFLSERSPGGKETPEEEAERRLAQRGTGRPARRWKVLR